jgi:hypothetical protein
MTTKHYIENKTQQHITITYRPKDSKTLQRKLKITQHYIENKRKQNIA